ncbi:U3 small nucleolar RNA-associated protein 20 [Psilocybe cubensis]|uniref:U3 small nucleolar RNA-associated protein 20 n=1 Tax=Psilocybe cubensis TaxID=181762 RepID=A0ACB8HDP8_PSICU|nr:U3 small nucleolar RNA-associated protein 20 [Psilocybe cubensis]KAH9485782.1 U3 small nucleolar RNA-associated protein 20 [Psilocybe cubensis]
MSTMRAVVYDGAFKVTVREVEKPKLLHPDDIIAVYQSDLHMYEGRTAAQAGIVFGHENMGIVDEVGAGVTLLKKGDRVVMPFNVACGRCLNCEEGKSAFCTNVNPGFAGGAYGYVAMGPYVGGQAEYVKVPFADFNALKLPPGTEHEEDFALLADIFPTGWHGVQLSGFKPGESIVVFGAGPVGLMAAYSAVLRGASEVYVVDRVPERLQKAKDINCIPIDFSRGDAVQQILDHRGGQATEVDRGVDAVGYQATTGDGKTEQPNAVLEALIRVVRPTGGLGIPGLYVPSDPGAPDSAAAKGYISFPFGKLFEKGLSLGTGQCNVKAYNRYLRDLIISGKAKPSFVVSHNIPLDNAADAYDKFDRRVDGYTKVLLHPKSDFAYLVEFTSHYIYLLCSRQKQAIERAMNDMDVDEPMDVVPQVKRFKDNDSHFHEALDHWRQLNLSPSFIQFAKSADGLSASMPLLLHNWRDIYALWLEAFKSADDEGLRALLDLLQKMAHDLRTTLSPIYSSLLETLLSLLPSTISAAALTSLLETLSSIFRYLLIPAIDTKLIEETWLTICSTLPKCHGEIQRAVAEVWGGVLRRMKSGARERAVELLAEKSAYLEDASAWVIVFACKESDTTQEKDIAVLKKMFEIVAVVCGVRSGSRLTESQKSLLFSQLNHLPIIPDIHTTLLRYLTALFFAGDMSLWLGPGLKFLQRIWSTTAIEGTDDSHTHVPFTQTQISFTLKFNLCLADAGWGGWKLIASPVLMKSVIKPELCLIDKEQRRLIAFLAALQRDKKLGAPSDIDVVWRRKIEGMVLDRLSTNEWKQGSSDDMVTELDGLLTLLPFCLTTITTPLIDIINLHIDSTSCRAEDVTAANSVRLLGLCLNALSKRDTSEWAAKIDLEMWTRKGLEKWAWSHEVLAGLVVVAQASPFTKTIPLHQVYPSLYNSLISHSRALRLSALRLLDCKLVDPQHDQVEVLKRCLQGEEVSLDLQGVRERVLRIGRVGQVVGDEKGADLCARWLIAQLKVNLRPLWSPATAALGTLAQRFGDLVWKLLFEELRKVTLPPPGGSISPSQSQSSERGQDHSGEEAEHGNDADPWEEERSWRDPSAHKLRSIVLVWDDPEREKKRLQNEQDNEERFDILSYEYQLLATLGECSLLAEKHNRDLVPHFLMLNGQSELSTSSSLLPKPKLLAWLTLFSKFSNPKALYATDTLRALYITNLSHPDRSLQSIALSCLFTYKSPHLTPYEDRIRSLLDDTRWRDELALLEVDDIPAASRGEVISVIIRLLFGVMLEKKNRGRGGGGGGDRRAAVLSAFARCRDDELGLLVDLMLRPFGWDRSSPTSLVSEGHNVFQIEMVDMNSHSLSDKQVAGYLTLLGDVLKTLGSRLMSYWPALLGMTVDITATAQARIDGIKDKTPVEKDGEEVTIDEVELADDAEIFNPSVNSTKAIRAIRQLGLKRFADFFRIPVIFDFTPYMMSVFSAIINPRLPALDRENTQAPSALLDLFHVWTVDGMHVPLLVDYNNDTLPKIYDCLVATNVKPAVISKIFDIVDNLLGCSADDEYAREHVLKPHVSRLLANLSILVERTKGQSTIATPIGQRQIHILSEIAQYSTSSEQATTLLALFNPLLRRPAKIVPEKVKMGLVKIIGELIHLIPDMQDRRSTTYSKTYGLLSQLFQSLRSRVARISLVATFHRLAGLDSSLNELANLLDSLNAYSPKRIDEPDFERRLDAFATLNETMYKSFSCTDWLPILYNMLNFIQDPVELAVRNSASYAMRNFIDLVAAQTSPEFEDTFAKALFPALKNGLRSKNELVRAEILGVIAYSVEKCENIAVLQDMRVLLEGGDEEANFFNNILHIQVHRRSRALRRLADHCDEGHLKNTTISEIFVPLVSNFISSTTSVDHHLVNDAILATGRMAKQLAWGAYYSLVQKYIKLSRAKDESERIYIRTLVALLDNFHFPMEEVIIVPEQTTEEMVVEEDEDEDTVEPEVLEQASAAARAAKNTARIADAVNLRLLPSLLSHLEKHDKTTDDNTRIPISIGIVTVAKHLPAATRDSQITRLITILSQIMRSKSQETRDLTRDSLNRIAVALGPSYLPIILRELRAALLRGPQLHVLAYAVHSLILHVTSGEHAAEFTMLDDCVNDVAYVSAEVIFGESGKDVQAEDFKTKMREVRASSSMGLDSFAIIAKFVTPPKISSLLLPVKTIMQETEAIKVMTLVEEVLKRISTGLNSNKHLVQTELLALCNTLISQNAKFLQQTPSRRKASAKGDAIVQMKRNAASEVDHYANNSFRFVTFGLELLNTALKRNRFDFREPAQLSRLESMVVVVGNTLYSTNASVLILGMRCAAGLVKCPLKAITKSIPVIVQQILDIIRQTGNTESELVQVAFKSLGAILRDGPPVQVKEKDLVYLIELLSPDLEEPDRQAAVFTLLRAIVARKFVVPEIYDLMEKVSEVSVTSQSTQVQELCRGVLLQFLLDYPQGKGRLRNQMAFFAKNLSYIHESGRTSIMELLSAVIVKFQANLIQEYADLLFVALVMVVANDESSKCREMAAQLIKNLWSRLDEERRNALLSHLHSWTSQSAQPLLTWVAVQVYGFIIDIAQAETQPYISVVLEDLKSSLNRSSAAIKTAEEFEEANDMEVELEWQLPYHSLTVLTKVVRVYPSFATEEDKVEWLPVIDHLLFPHAWVRTAACRLLGLFFSAVPVAAPRTNLPDEHPLSRTGMQLVARQLTQQLKSEHLDEALGLQVVKNLFYLGKCFYLMPVADATAIDEDAEDILDNENGGLAAESLGQETSDKLKNLHSPLPWLFSKVSYQIKSGHIARRSKAASRPNWSQQPLAGLRWFAAMTSHMEAERLEQFLVHILTPVYRIIEDDTIRDSQMEELKTTATELQDLVQSKVGTTKFATVYNQIRQSVLGVRRERKVARVLQASTHPEAAAKRKIQRNAIKKDSRKRKERGFLEKKGKAKRRREE